MMCSESRVLPILVYGPRLEDGAQRLQDPSLWLMRAGLPSPMSPTRPRPHPSDSRTKPRGVPVQEVACHLELPYTKFTLPSRVIKLESSDNLTTCHVEGLLLVVRNQPSSRVDAYNAAAVTSRRGATHYGFALCVGRRSSTTAPPRHGEKRKVPVRNITSSPGGCQEVVGSLAIGGSHQDGVQPGLSGSHGSIRIEAAQAPLPTYTISLKGSAEHSNHGRPFHSKSQARTTGEPKAAGGTFTRSAHAS